MTKEQIKLIDNAIKWSIRKFEEYTFIPYMHDGEIDPDRYAQNQAYREKR